MPLLHSFGQHRGARRLYSGCRVNPLGPPGLHTTARELQTRTFEGPGASNTTTKKFHQKTPRGTKGGGSFLTPDLSRPGQMRLRPRRRPGPQGGSKEPTFSGFGSPTPSRPPPFWVSASDPHPSPPPFGPRSLLPTPPRDRPAERNGLGRSGAGRAGGWVGAVKGRRGLALRRGSERGASRASKQVWNGVRRSQTPHGKKQTPMVQPTFGFKGSKQQKRKKKGGLKPTPFSGGIPNRRSSHRWVAPPAAQGGSQKLGNGTRSAGTVCEGTLDPRLVEDAAAATEPVFKGFSVLSRTVPKP